MEFELKDGKYILSHMGRRYKEVALAVGWVAQHKLVSAVVFSHYHGLRLPVGPAPFGRGTAPLARCVRRIQVAQALSKNTGV